MEKITYQHKLHCTVPSKTFHTRSHKLFLEIEVLLVKESSLLTDHMLSPLTNGLINPESAHTKSANMSVYPQIVKSQPSFLVFNQVIQVD